MKYIENEGQLYRGHIRGNPAEVWDKAQKKFVPYKGDIPKGESWGNYVADDEAKRIMES